jgi:hypothetical protein
MRTLLLLVLFATLGTVSYAQPNYIPDLELRYILSELNSVVIDEDGYLVDPDAEHLTLIISTTADMEGVDLTGLEYVKTYNLIMSNEEGGSFGAFPAFPQMLLQEGTNENSTFLNGFNGDEVPPLSENTYFVGIYNPVHIGSWSLVGAADANTTIVELIGFPAAVPMPSIVEQVDFVSISGWPHATLPTIGANVQGLSVEYASTLTSVDLSSVNLTQFAAKYSEQLISIILPTNTMEAVHLEELPVLADLSPLPATANVVLQTLPALTSLSFADCGILTMWNMNGSLITTWPGAMQQLELINCSAVDMSGLPADLEQLRSEGTAVTQLPWLPSGLQSLRLLSSGLQCLPVLPAGLTTLEVDVPCIPNQPPLIAPYTLCTLLSSYCRSANPTVSGHVFLDLDEDGVQDGDEPDVMNATLQFLPSGHFTGTDAAGNYVIGLPIGTHTLRVVSAQPNNGAVLPAELTVELPSLGILVDSMDFRIGPPPPDLSVEDLYGQTPPRPGFERVLSFMTQAVSVEEADVQVTIEISPQEEIISTDLPNATINGNVITAGHQAYTYGHIRVRTSTNTFLGSTLVTRVSIGTLENDPTPANNTRLLESVVVGSYDPNDKQVFPALLTPDEVATDTLLEYLVRFQNTGTYHAERVVITDTLSTDLRWDTFRFLESSHTCEWYMADGVAHFIFNDIMLPDSNANEPESHGFVRFSIRPSTALQQGESVNNIANIYFDFNEPVITEPCVLAVELPTAMEDHLVPSAILSPNPTTNVLNVRLPTTDSYTAEILTMDGRSTQVVGILRSPFGISVASLPSGAYILRLTSRAHGVHQVRFVKD